MLINEGDKWATALTGASIIFLVESQAAEMQVDKHYNRVNIIRLKSNANVDGNEKTVELAPLVMLSLSAN